ncbi:MgtC/SapB family protein [Eubacterium oxidoreducens]|uniref:Putative Mg2+ transporter-C (MgtC) family protein n=1 Tax=Eubacterium oxidoreducens TaxID=1732 RepID=A0A1G6A5T5_EUBOX|nr:MgtC/SapB family protein [Eubacterium oxidoreducens]SDB03759.1 putative Mg2+ transporter-C (MgtC) family protein [Eubacterium oxidoreducens]
MGHEIVFDYEMVEAIIRILLSAGAGALIGAERMMRGRAAGLRTHIIVCVGSALTVLIGIYAYEMMGGAIDPLRIGAQVVSGIGFLGVGTILIRGRSEVKGLTTAAGLWTTAAIGLGFGAGCYILSALVTIITFVTIFLVARIERQLEMRRKEFQMYLEIDDVIYVNEVFDWLQDHYEIDELDVTAPRTAIHGNVGVELVLSTKEGANAIDVKEAVQSHEHILLALESI